MRTKNIFTTLSIALLLLGGITSCTKNNLVAPPSVTNLEIGSNNSKTAYPGADLHIEGDIVALASITSIKVNIQPKTSSGWTFSKTYTDKYAGAKNAELHEHIDVPADAAVGSYDLHITVTDKAGNTAEIDSELNIIIDPTLPSITGFAVAYVSADAELHVEGNITAPNKIAEIELEIHGGNFEKDYVITGNYVGQTTFNLQEHFSLSDVPAGHYHVHLMVKDQSGKEREFEEHFDK